MPGVRVPLSGDIARWDEVMELGRRVIWLETYGERLADGSAGRPAGERGVRLPDAERPRARELGGSLGDVPARK